MAEFQPGHIGLHALPGPGTEIGAYRILDLLGTGGMGQVFLAEHKKLGRRVALKLLLPEFAGNREVISRFFHEAKAVNQINHQHIVEIVDFVEDPGGFNYFIMELLDGRDLSQSREHDGPFSLERTVSIIRQILSALAATHAKAIVHRDLKPENIFLVSREGNQDFVKLLDFGIAKLSNQELGDARPRTRTGMILGTPEYMSPEQAGGQVVDHRSDIYAVGVILYWMISDRLPFIGRSVGELLAKQLTSSPTPLPDVAPSGERIPSALSALTLRCLARDPQRRPLSPQLLDELNQIDVTPYLLQHPKRRPMWPVYAIGAAVLVTLAAISFLVLGAPRPPLQAPAAPPSSQVGSPAAAVVPAAPAPAPAPAPTAPAELEHEAAAMPPPPESPSPRPPTPATAPAEPPRPPAAAAVEAHPKPAAAVHRAKPKPKAPRPEDDSSGMLDPYADP
jgi:serine/threonine-protein kinase